MTSARRRAEIDADFREAIGLILRPISADGLIVLPGWDTSAGVSRILNFRPERSRLRQTGRGRLFLYVELVFLVMEGVDQPRVQILSHIYTAFDAREQRIFGWHHHPGGRAGESVSTPHLHIYVHTEVGARMLSKLHLPTGRVDPQDVVTFLIDELAVELRAEYQRIE